MSDHAAVKEEHRKRLVKLREVVILAAALPRDTWDREAGAQFLADFERDERLKEAEWCEKAVCTHRCLERGFDEHVPNCKSTILKARIEQLKRGEL